MLLNSVSTVYAENLTGISNPAIDKPKLFKEAIESYQQKQYTKSIQALQDLINSGVKNADLYYDLANAYFKSDQIGKSILNYKNALVLSPRDPDAKANLKFALEQTKDQFSSEDSIDPILRILAFWYFDLNLFELIALTLVVNIFTCFCVFICFFYKNEILKVVQWVLIVLLLVLIVSTVIKLYYNFNPSEGVIVATEADVKCGDDSTYKTLFKIHEGAEFKIEDKRDKWYKIRLKDNRKGWINSDVIGLVIAGM